MQMRKLKFREVTLSVQGQTAIEKEGRILSLGWALKRVLCLIQKAISCEIFPQGSENTGWR